jgi:hypothetical protein
MKKFILTPFLLFTVCTSFNVSALTTDTSISFEPSDKGLRISVKGADAFNISECYLDGKPICSTSIHSGNFVYDSLNEQANIDVELNEETSGILDKRPLFSVQFYSGKKLVTRASFENNVSYTSSGKKLKKASFSSDNDLAYLGKDPILNKLIHEAAFSLKEYKKLHPQASDEVLNQYAQKILHSTKMKARRAARAYTDMNGYLSGILNSKEYALYKANTVKGLLCLANGKFALDYAASNYIVTVLHNGNGDAFRHSLWNYGMTIDVGSTFAKQWSDAHEYGSSGQPAIERSMDLYNNAIGIQLGKNNPWTFFHSTFISNTKAKVRAGGMLIISNGRLVASSSYGEK